LSKYPLPCGGRWLIPLETCLWSCVHLLFARKPPRSHRRYKHKHVWVTVHIYPANRRWTTGAWRKTFTLVYVFLVKSFNRSWTRDFLRFYPILTISPDFTHFLFFQTIQYVKYVLTRKIVWFYESKRDFNNLDWNDIFSRHKRTRILILDHSDQNSLIIMVSIFFFIFLSIL